MKKRHIVIGVLGATLIGGAFAYVSKRNAPPPDPVAKTLFEASQKGYLSQVERFLELGAEIDASGARKQTPLIAALAYSHEKVALALIAKGAGVRQADGRGLTAAHYAAANNQVEALKALKGKGADLGLVNREGFSPIYLAKTYRSTEAYEYLKRLGLLESAPTPSPKKAASRLSKGPG